MSKWINNPYLCQCDLCLRWMLRRRKWFFTKNEENATYSKEENASFLMDGTTSLLWKKQSNFDEEKNLQKQTFKWRKPANRGEWLLTEALLFQTMPRQLMRLHSPFNICVANVCQNICIYRIGNTCTLLEIHVPYWKHI